MADEPLPRVGKGDPITADWANAVADAINARGASDPNANGTATPYGIMTPADTETQMRAPDAQAMPFDAAIIRNGGDDELWMAIPSGLDLVRLNAVAVDALPEQTKGDATSAWVKLEDVVNGSERFAFLAFGYPEDPNVAQELGWRVFVTNSQSPGNWPAWVDATRPALLLASYHIAADDTSGVDSAPGDVPSLRKGLVQHHRGAATFGGGTGDPCLFDLRATPAGELYIYLGADSSLVGPNNAVRVNGRPVAFDASALTHNGEGWWLVPATYPWALWIEFSSPSGGVNALDAAENWLGGTGGSAGTPVVATIVAAGASYVPSFPDGRAFHRVLLWYRQIGAGSAWSPTGPWTRCVQGGMDITVDLGDADGGVQNASAGLSIEHGVSGDQRLSLYGFTGIAIASPNSSVSEMAFPIRRWSSGGKPYVQYVTGVTVARSDSLGKLYIGASDIYAPTQITYTDGNGDPQTITVLKKQ